MQKKSKDSLPDWSTPSSIKDYLRNKWDKGVFLNSEESGLFPLCINIKGPAPTETTEKYSETLKWISEFEGLTKQECVDVIWEERNNRLSGKNQLPVKICIPNVVSLAAFIGKTSDLKKWHTSLEMVTLHIPELLAWWQMHPNKALPLTADLSTLEKLLKVCHWCRDYIQSQMNKIYIRQIPLEGIHTKFIEANKSVLATWLDFLCPALMIHSEYSQGSGFAKRYGFLDKPQLVRIRILDPRLFLSGLSDLTIVAEELAAFDLQCKNIFICENNVTCLGFPPVADSILIYGGGYGFDALSQIHWLHTKRIFYWGDLDTNGFCILDQLRSHFPQVQSFLMDEKTLLANRDLWCREERPTCRDLQNLTESERCTYQRLCDHYWGDHVRLEQELISMTVAQSIIHALVLKI